jgi:hypothetical protein
MFLYYFNILISKIIFKIKLKYYFNQFLSKNILKINGYNTFKYHVKREVKYLYVSFIVFDSWSFLICLLFIVF